MAVFSLTLHPKIAEIGGVFQPCSMTTEIRNWAVVAAALEAKGATNSQMYRRAKALADGLADPMPTSFPAAPFSISAA